VGCLLQPFLALSLLLASTPDMVCLEPGLCTPVLRLAAADGVQRVHHADRVPPRLDPAQPFALWLTWPNAPEPLRHRVERRQRAEWKTVLPGTRLRLALVPGVVSEPTGGKSAGVLAFLASDPLGGAEGAETSPGEAVAGAEALKLLSPEQATAVTQWRTSEAAWHERVAAAWRAFIRSPRDLAGRTRLLEAMSSEPAPPAPESFLTPAQRTELRRRGHPLEGRILVDDLPGDAYRLRVEAVPLDQLVEDWNAGLRALVGRLERVPRPRFRILPGHRHDEVSFTLEVRSDVEEMRVSQVARRLAQVPGLERDGAELPPPGL
jgi:hypothetical protein